jgi:hypothetical protein
VFLCILFLIGKNSRPAFQTARERRLLFAQGRLQHLIGAKKAKKGGDRGAKE